MNVHGMCVQARHEGCTVCHAGPEQPCVADRDGVHMCRICLATDHGRITRRDEASIMYGPPFTGRSLVLDEVTA